MREDVSHCPEVETDTAPLLAPSTVKLLSSTRTRKTTEKGKMPGSPQSRLPRWVSPFCRDRPQQIPPPITNELPSYVSVFGYVARIYFARTVRAVTTKYRQRRCMNAVLSKFRVINLSLSIGK